MRRPFTFYRRISRKTNRGKPVYVFYCRFRDADGIRSPAISTGCTSESAAENWAVTYLKKNPPKGKGTVAEFVEHFFIPGECKWVASQRGSGRKFGDYTAMKRRGHTENWIIPALGARRLTSVTKADIRDFVAALPLKDETKNGVLDSVRIIFQEAEDRGLVTDSPAAKVKHIIVQDATKRAVFTADEMRLLFPHDRTALLPLWGGLEAAAAMLTLASTGLRSGEVRALAWKHLLDGGLLVERGVKAGSNGIIGTTKTGEPRPVPIPSRTESLILEWREASPWTEPEDIIFPSPQRGRPLHKHYLAEHLVSAMVSVGIPLAGLSPHSFRHWYNTILRGRVPGEVLRALTGHKSEDMTRHYDNPSVDIMFARVQAARPVLDALWQ